MADQLASQSQPAVTDIGNHSFGNRFAAASGKQRTAVTPPAMVIATPLAIFAERRGPQDLTTPLAKYRGTSERRYPRLEQQN